MANNPSDLYKKISVFFLFLVLLSIKTMQWTSVICLSFSHSLGSGLSSTVHISGWASITWFWFLYLSYGPEEHANRSSKNNFGELIWMLARKRVILCSLGFLGAVDYLHPHEKLVKHINTEERYGGRREMGRNAREQRWCDHDGLSNPDQVIPEDSPTTLNLPVI